MIDLKTYGMESLELHAAHLNAICVPDPAARVGYDILGDALFWSDETLESTPIEVIVGLRQLRHYRTHVMLKGTSNPTILCGSIANRSFRIGLASIPIVADRRQNCLPSIGGATFPLDGACERMNARRMTIQLQSNPSDHD